MNPFFLILTSILLATTFARAVEKRPNIIFVMADDMGWGQTGYRGHPVLKTPNLDAMAANGLRFDRFYAGSPVCSPTRASVLTGRSPDRAGVLSHGYALRRQEKTIAQALKAAGYVTGHFGKWHLNGYRGPGAPILRDDPLSPGTFGFDEWVSVTNFYDQNPLMSRQGEITEFKGDSSDVVVDEALRFIEKHRAGDQPLFMVIWYGTPHSPFRALPEDKAAFADLDASSADHYGELVALDRSVGVLRAKLREWGIAENTLVMFNSDNGGLPKIQPETVGGLRGFKGTTFEGGIRVPAIMEWPAVIQPRVTSYPACTMDLFPTVADILGLPREVMVQPVDGKSLKPLLTQEIGPRQQALPFRYGSKAAWVDDDYKLVTEDLKKGQFMLYDLKQDPQETHDLSAEAPERFAAMKAAFLKWNEAADASFAGKDYPEGRVSPPDPESVAWYESEAYRPYIESWKNRWEYQSYLNGSPKGKGKKAKKED